jgi:hypothetical protein
MSVTVNGNHSKGYLGRGSTGNGVQNVVQGIGWQAATASEAGDVAYLSLTGAFLSDINQGIFFQAESSATIEFTLCNSGLAASIDPTVQASVLWGNSLSLPANTITKAPVLFTVCKITFGAPGTVYMGVR